MNPVERLLRGKMQSLLKIVPMGNGADIPLMHQLNISKLHVGLHSLLQG
jgi:hypothetical protein